MDAHSMHCTVNTVSVLVNFKAFNAHFITGLKLLNVALHTSFFVTSAQSPYKAFIYNRGWKIEDFRFMQFHIKKYSVADISVKGTIYRQ